MKRIGQVSRGESRAWRAVRFGLVIAAIGAWAVVLRPTSLGGLASYLLVRGSSMEPTYADGDLLILRAAPSYGIGDAVAYRVPDGEIGAGHLVIHRITGGSADAGFELQGDNNDAPDPWNPRGSSVVGTVQFAIPALGRVLGFLHQPLVLGALAAAIVMGWMVASAGSSSSRRPETVEA